MIYVFVPKLCNLNFRHFFNKLVKFKSTCVIRDHCIHSRYLDGETHIPWIWNFLFHLVSHELTNISWDDWIWDVCLPFAALKFLCRQRSLISMLHNTCYAWWLTLQLWLKIKFADQRERTFKPPIYAHTQTSLCARAMPEEL